MPTQPHQRHDAPRAGHEAEAWLGWFFRALLVILAACCLLGGAFSVAWLYQGGDMAIERAVEAQSASMARAVPDAIPQAETAPVGDGASGVMGPGHGPLILFGPGQDLSESDIMDYKVALAAATRPSVVVMGAAPALSLRAESFTRPMVNMAGSLGLDGLSRALDALMAGRRPDVVIIALDYRWFGTGATGGPAVASASHEGEGFSLSPSLLRLPWRELFTGRCSLGQFLSPLYLGFRDDRFGARAQFDSEGFGPDGSWYPTRLVTGHAPADRSFAGVLDRESRRAGSFAHSVLDPARVDAFADIYFRARARGAMPVVYVSPLAGPLYGQMRERKEAYPQLFTLAATLAARGIQVLDASDAALVGATDCEFLDAETPGEIACARVLGELVNMQPRLLAYVNMERVSRVINEWAGHALARETRVSEEFETDFLGLGCLKKTR